jgi:uncharacterized membrane protein (UPF0127 family)
LDPRSSIEGVIDLMSLRGWFTPKGVSEKASRLRVRNITRNTQIATEVELADSGPRRSRGLLGRKGLAAGEGLWIVPCEAVHTFGMQFSIDLVYIDREYRIRKIRRNVPPWRLSACLRAHSVIELAAGSIHDNIAQPGDIVEISTFNPG